MTMKPTGTMPSTRMTTGRRSPSQLPPPQLPRELPGQISHLAGCQRSHSQESRARGARRFSCGERAKRIQRVVKHQILLWRIRQRWRRVQPSQRNRRAKMQVPALASSRSTSPMSPKARRTIRSLRLPNRKKRIRKSQGTGSGWGRSAAGVANHPCHATPTRPLIWSTRSCAAFPSWDRRSTLLDTYQRTRTTIPPPIVSIECLHKSTRATVQVHLGEGMSRCSTSLWVTCSVCSARRVVPFPTLYRLSPLSSGRAV
mmetsp:Transcript_13164/g.55620  ORF Transcript_13164/g.55620 Transcript_13164/m.55620 type:complete len:257 (+) Transcript_13164:725-1495(+)